MEVMESAKYFGNLGRFDAEKMKAHDCPMVRRNNAFYANAKEAKRKFSEMPAFTTRGLPAKLGYDLTDELRDLQIEETVQTTLEHTTKTNMLSKRLCRCTDEVTDYKFDHITKSKENTGKGRKTFIEKGNCTKVTENCICLCPTENKTLQNDKRTGNSRTLEKVMPPPFKGQRQDNNNDRGLRSKKPSSLPCKDAKRDLSGFQAVNVSQTEQESSDLDAVTNSLSRIENAQSKIKGEMNEIRNTLNKKAEKIEKSYKMITSDVRELGELVELARFVNNRIERCSIRERLKKHFEDRNEVVFSLEQESG